MQAVSADTWRVQVTHGAVITHSSEFPREFAARDYFEVLDVPGTIEMQVRKAGKRKFITVMVRARSRFAGT